MRYDGERRVVGTIAPDSDGAAPYHYQAVRNTYDAAGRLVTVEKGDLTAWQSEMVDPSMWGSAFTAYQKVDTTYDAMDRKLVETVSGRDPSTLAWIPVPTSLTQYSYDTAGRLECSAVRMNPAAYGSPLPHACAPGTEGSQGPDRITRTVYDEGDQVLSVQRGVGTPLQQDYARYTYSPSGKQTSVTDANGNKASMSYDGFDRQTRWTFPDKVTVGAVSATDYEAYGYDANGNRVSLRKRDGQTIGYSYDALNRMTVKDIPGGTAADVYYSYDLRGLQLSARFGSASGPGLVQDYDGFGRVTSASNTLGGTPLTLGYQWDADGNRTRITHADGVYVDYSYDQLERATGAAWKTPSAAGVAFLGIAYDVQGRRSTTTRGSSATSYTYDAVSRLASDTQSFASGSANTTSGYGYNPASQIVSKSRTNTAYAFTGYESVSRAYAANGLNQYTSGGPATFSYDPNGNLTGDGTSGYGYDVENRLVSRSNGLAIAYDPNGRLWQTSGGASGTTRYLYDGDNLVAEYDAAGNMLKRYLFGPGVDEPVAEDSGSLLNCSQTRFLHPDAQGSIVATADCWGSPVAINTYDEYGIPGAGNTGRFRYTGQIWLPDLGMYYYKARIYSPTLGRFLQTDPIGYKDQINLYAYVGNDPVNNLDPTGMADKSFATKNDPSDLIENGANFDWPGTVTIFSHGAPLAMQDSPHHYERLTNSEIISAINSVSRTQPVILLGCREGSDGARQASEIAAAIGRPVMASTSQVWWSAGKNGWYSARAYWKNPSGKVDFSRPGEFKVFGGNVSSFGINLPGGAHLQSLAFNSKTGAAKFTVSYAVTGTRIQQTEEISIGKK